MIVSNFKSTFIEHVVDNFEEIPGDNIFKLWAKHKIDYLSENMDKNKQEVIKLSKEFKVPSSVTSFICIKENSQSSDGDMIKIKIPKIRDNIHAFNNGMSIPFSNAGMYQANRSHCSAVMNLSSEGRTNDYSFNLRFKRRRGQTTRDSDFDTCKKVSKLSDEFYNGNPITTSETEKNLFMDTIEKNKKRKSAQFKDNKILYDSIIMMQTIEGN